MGPRRIKADILQIALADQPIDGFFRLALILSSHDLQESTEGQETICIGYKGLI